MTEKKATRMHLLQPIACLVFSIMGLMGCVANGSTTSTHTTGPPAGRVVLLPFLDMTARLGENESTTNPLTGKVFVTGVVEGKADDVLTELLYRLLKQKKQYVLIPPAPAAEALVDISATAANQSTERQRLLATSRHFGADAILSGRLYRYVQRVGGNYGVEQPASVAFDLVMLQADTGRVLWRRHMDETQTSLTENLFSLGNFLKRKGKWVTAEQMAETGMKEMLETLPHLE